MDSGTVFITGDKHGSFRVFFGLAEKKIAGPDDVILITGDTGYVQDEEYPLKICTLQQLFPGTVCFIDGNHDNHRILNALPQSVWHGGRVHRLGERVFHLMRGELFEIGGRTFFALGGARTVANYIEGEEGIDYWPGEEPAPEELAYAARRLSENADCIDYVITHEAPLSAREQIPRLKRIDADYRLPAMLEDWLRLLEGRPRFTQWYFGHMHVDQQISPVLRAVFNNVIDLGTGKTVRWW